MYKLLGVILFPAIFYDGYTSYSGAVTYFGAAITKSEVLWALPIVLSVTALVVNFMTVEILSDNSVGFVKFFWFVCLIFDCYTTFVGLGNFKITGDVSQANALNISQIAREVDTETMLFLFIGMLLITISPMFSFWLLKR
jgi:hypothetical protein